MNVYQAAQERISKIFSEFDNIYISFSGGKDSGVLLNMCIDFVRKNTLNRKIGVFHIDYEAQYQMTTEYVDAVFSSNSDILEYYRICLPISAQCATSMYQDHWTPWDIEYKDIWVRKLPENSINENNNPCTFFKREMWDYDFQIQFSKWNHHVHNAKRTCCLVGIRTQESLNRWRAIYSDRNFNKFDNNNWTNKIFDNVYNAYPLFDWKTEDIWTANARFGWEYNKLYDLYYMAGLNIDQMRVASPFNNAAQDSLKIYRVIDPNNWAKMIGRVNGINFTGIYGGTTAMGWKSIKLPKGHTWKSYMYFLLDTLPKQTRENYLSKLKTSIKFWREKGGVLSEKTIQKLRGADIEIEVYDKTNYKTDKKPVRMEYIDEIDIEEFKEIPTYKRVCICIMKNDHLCKYMGFSQTKKELERRKSVMDKYNDIL